MVVNLLLVVVSFVAMEGVACFTHKYIMHGFMWCWHASHHRRRQGLFERNDWFAVVFAIPAAAMIIVGSSVEPLGWLRSCGVGITGYGVCYVAFHDILVHRRIRHRWNPRFSYLQGLMRAHRLHHKKKTKEHCVSFGFLWAPRKYSMSEAAVPPPGMQHV